MKYSFRLSIVPDVENVLHHTVREVTDRGVGPMALGERFLIHAEQGDRQLLLGQEASSHGLFYNVYGLVPADVKDARGALNAHLQQNIDGKPFEESGEARAGLNPRWLYLLDAVFWIFNPKRPGTLKGRIDATGPNAARCVPPACS